MSEIKTKDKRARNFYTCVYPESAPADWLSILSDLCIPSLVSPLHDSDVNPDGEIKKPHYHVLFMFDGKKTEEQVRSVVDKIHGVGCDSVVSVRGYARYLCHLDNPEKAQYPVENVTALGGADYFATISIPTDKYKAVSEMIDFCKQENIFSFAQLLEFSREFRFDWFRVLCDSSTLVMKEYLKSRSWTEEHREEELLNDDTEELRNDN